MCVVNMGSNHNIPLEAVVKYLAKERDNYKQRLDQIVPYTKSLEEKIRRYEECFEKASEDPKDVSFLKTQLLLIKTENRMLIKEYKKSNWYKSLEGKINKVCMENLSLRRALTALKDENKLVI